MSARDLLSITVPMTRGAAKHLRRLVRSEVRRRERTRENQERRRGGAFVPAPGKGNAHEAQVTRLKEIEEAITAALGPTCPQCGGDHEVHDPSQR